MLAGSRSDAPATGTVNALAAQRPGMLQILAHIRRQILRVIAIAGCLLEP